MADNKFTNGVSDKSSIRAGSGDACEGDALKNAIELETDFLLSQYYDEYVFNDDMLREECRKVAKWYIHDSLNYIIGEIAKVKSNFAKITWDELVELFENQGLIRSFDHLDNAEAKVDLALKLLDEHVMGENAEPL